MAATSAYTLAEATEMLTLCKTALRELISGQAKAYRVGSREFTALNIDELKDWIIYFSDIVEALSGKARTTRVARVVPRDL
ncbi:MAG: DUF6148 family protein [Lachnospiraceae bacterium]|nr:DUF6148 family protein [Lachnospiraceae bacterium]